MSIREGNKNSRPASFDDEKKILIARLGNADISSNDAGHGAYPSGATQGTSRSHIAGNGMYYCQLFIGTFKPFKLASNGSINAQHFLLPDNLTPIPGTALALNTEEWGLFGARLRVANWYPVTQKICKTEDGMSVVLIRGGRGLGTADGATNTGFAWSWRDQPDISTSTATCAELGVTVIQATTPTPGQLWGAGSAMGFDSNGALRFTSQGAPGMVADLGTGCTGTFTIGTSTVVINNGLIVSVT